MPLIEFEGRRPHVHPEAFVAPTATLIGDVVVEEGASVWYGAVLRADDCRIVLRRNANVQDNSVIHGRADVTVEVGEGATVAHGCVVHGATLGPRALLGNTSSMMDDSSLGEEAMVGAGSMVGAGTHIDAGMLAVGIPAREIKPIHGTGAQLFVENNPIYYPELARRHRDNTAVLDH